MRNISITRRVAVLSIVVLSACGSDAPDNGGGGTGGASIEPPQPSGCIDDVSAGDHVYDCDGITYDARVPEACTTHACGLIFDVHGYSMSGVMQEASTHLKVRGEEHGYIVFQPNAPGNPPLSSWTPATDDDKVFAVLELARDTFHVDTDRIHFTGFSQGGAMTWRMLCHHADVLASVAPAAEGACDFVGAEIPSREVDVLFLHGHLDALVSFDTVAVPQRDAVVAGWEMGTGDVVASDADYTRTRFTSAGGTHFDFLEHQYSAGPCLITIDGHCFPGSDDPGTEPGQACSFACLPTNAFNWGEQTMQFFLDHPRR